MTEKKSKLNDDSIKDIDYEEVNAEPENDASDTVDENSETDELPETALATINNTNIAKLEGFTNVEQIKQFAIQLGISGSPESVAQRIIRGRELGIDAMMAFDNIYIVNGRATLSVHLVNFLIKRAGYEIRTVRDNEYLQKDGNFSPVKTAESVDRCCTIEFIWRSKLTNEVMREQYTYWWSEAIAAGLTTKDTWQKYSKQLLWARTLVFGARRVAAEALMGFYETSEIADTHNVDYKVTDAGNAIPIN